MSGLELRGVRIAYDGVPAVVDVDAAVPSGGWLGLLGPNGAGKSTLLKAVAGLVEAAGEIAVDGAPVSGLGRRRLAQLVAFVPQRPQIPSTMTVTDYVLLGRTPYIPYLGTEGLADLDVVAGVVDRLELARLTDRPLGSLSGGEAQRAILARALAQQAPILLLDEPTAALDVGHQQQVLELIDELRREQALTVVAAMHDLTLAGQFAEELLLLDAGRAAARGSAAEVLTADTIRRHYGASVRVEHTADGIVVLPTRARAAQETRT